MKFGREREIVKSEKRCLFLSFFIMLILTTHLQAKLFIKPEIGMIKYHIRNSDLRDVSGNLDTLVPGSIDIAPIMRVGLGMEYDDLKMFRSQNRTAGRLGLAVEYARRTHTAVVTDYFDTGSAIASFEGRQDIKRLNALLVGEYDAVRWRWLTGSIGVGLGVAHNPVTALRLYQKSNGAFIGQAIEPKHYNPHGYVGVSVKKSCTQLDALQYELGYRLGLTRVYYHDDIVQSKPDSTADVSAQNAYNLFRDLKLVQAPASTMLSHQLSFGVQLSF